MQQAIHIFRKDVLYLWREICMLVALALFFALLQPAWIDLLLLAAASFTISRLVHAEAIPGDHQFWITRPYRWQSLLAAKVVFVLVFVNLPLLLAQWYIVAIARVPFSSYAPGLFWSQLLFVLVVCLPVIALASVTSGLVPFTFLMLIVATLWGATDLTLWPPSESSPAAWPSAYVWIRDAVGVLALAAMVGTILYAQYRRRRTLFSRAVALGGVGVLALAWWYLPWTPAWALQTRLSKLSIDGSLMRISSDPTAVRLHVLRNRTWENVDVHIPITIGSAPDGPQIHPDALEITFAAADGAILKAEVGSVGTASDKAGGTMLDVNTRMSSKFFNRERGKNIRIRGSLYLTLFGHERETAITLTGEPSNAIDGLQCYVGPFEQFFCRSAFRWPARLVYAKSGMEMSPLTGLVSYSPFPAILRLHPFESRWAPSLPHASKEMMVAVEEPLAHIRRDFELRDVRVAASGESSPR